MDNDIVIGKVIDAVKQVQESSNRSAVGTGPETRPFTDVEGFDSLCGIEATVLLSQSLGQELPDSVFVPDEGRRVLSIGEIAENVCKYMSRGSVIA